jgi:cyanate permease
MPPPAHGRWLILAGVWFIYATFGLVASSLAPLVALIEADLGMRHATMGGIMGAWQLVYIAAALPCGVLLDRLGSRHALLIGALSIALSAAWRGAAGDATALLAAVMLFGVGGPIVSAGAPKVIATWFQGPSRGLAMGIYITGPAVGGVVSLTLTHAWLLPLLDGDWRRLLWLWAVFAAAAGLMWWLIASLPGLRSLADQRRPADSAPQRMVIAGLVREPSVRLVIAMGIGVFLISHGLTNWLPELLRLGGMDAVAAGYWAALPVAVGIAGALMIPRLAVPARRFLILHALCAALLAATVLLQFTHDAALFPGLVLQGIARSSLMTVLLLILVEMPAVGPHHTGTASALFFGAAEVGGMLGPLVLGLLYDFTHGFAAGLALLAAIGAGLVIGSHRLQRHLA